MLIERNSNALPLFFTETVYLVAEKQASAESDKEVKQTEKIVSEPEPASTPSLSAIPYEGKNLKKVLILFQNKQGKSLPESEKIFLGKVLQAVNLHFDDVALVNIHLLEEATYPLLNQFDASIWLSFSVVHETLPIHTGFPLYKITKANNIALLLANGLEEIESNRDKKVLLWNNLKTLFH